MKIRCVENSIRLRLRKSDISVLRKELKLIDTINFPQANYLKFGIALIRGDEVQAQFDDNHLMVNIPLEMATTWFDSNVVGIERFIPLAEEQSLHILIEKDFPCKHVNEDFEDTFYELQPDDTNC